MTFYLCAVLFRLLTKLIIFQFLNDSIKERNWKNYDLLNFVVVYSSFIAQFYRKSKKFNNYDRLEASSRPIDRLSVTHLIGRVFELKVYRKSSKKDPKTIFRKKRVSCNIQLQRRSHYNYVSIIYLKNYFFVDKSD